MDPKDIETELAKMKTTLEKNEYPRFIIDREVNMTIEKWNSRTENPQEKQRNRKSSSLYLTPILIVTKQQKS